MGIPACTEALRQTSAKILPCPRVRLRVVIMKFPFTEKNALAVFANREVFYFSEFRNFI